MAVTATELMPTLYRYHSRKVSAQTGLLALLTALCLLPGAAHGHGGVAFEEDQCVININFLQAHFTVFQPESRGNEEFCEDIPDTAQSVFVMEYLHDLLSEMAVDFRVVRDVNGVGRFATWEDIEAIEDLEGATVFYQPSQIEEGGYYRASYEFSERGQYIGVVTATHPVQERQYNAVFFFRVGGPDLGTLPLFLALLVLLQAGYWLSSGGYRRWRERRAEK